MDWESIIRNALRAGVNLDAAAYALAAIGLNMHFGYTGLLNFGQVGFMAVGAYSVAITVNELGLSMWLGLPIGILGAIVFALLLGLPTLRLRADYLAIVTIASAEIFRLVVRAASLREVTGGSSGMTQFARDFYAVNPFSRGTYGFWHFQFDERRFWLLLVVWSLIAVVATVVFLLMRSPWGRVIKAIREDEDAARSLGKNVYWYKMQSLIFGGICGAFAGFAFAIGTQSVQPDTYSSPVTFFALTALILGGMARVVGPIIGSVMFWMLLAFSDSFLRQAVNAGHISTSIMDSNQVGQVRFMLVGLALMLLPIFRPQGVLGDRREIDLDAR
ncbi:MAG TPA: branched-chain amino acid ABC transporter permease [Acidimicrobiales bacterium]|nr:branched-chain amino acid ABC transporter permease [Acidimicrobiales bacterium]